MHARYLQKLCFYRSLDLHDFVLRPSPEDHRFPTLQPAQWQRLTPADFHQRFTSQCMPAALRGLACQWPVRERVLAFDLLLLLRSWELWLQIGRLIK